MFIFRRCCDTSVDSKRKSAWIIGASLGAVVVTIVLQLTFGKSTYSQTLLYSAFPMALMASEQLSGNSGRSPLVRGVGMLLTMAAVYGFFLGVTVLADSF